MSLARGVAFPFVVRRSFAVSKLSHWVPHNLPGFLPYALGALPSLMPQGVFLPRPASGPSSRTKKEPSPRKRGASAPQRAE